MEEVFERQAVAGSQVNVLQHREDGDIPWTVEASNGPEGTLGMLLGATASTTTRASVPDATVSAAACEQVLGVTNGVADPGLSARPSSLAKFIAGAAEGRMLGQEDLRPDGDVLKALQALLAAAAGDAPAKRKLTAIERAKTLDTRTLVGRMSLSYPVLRAAATDTVTRALLISELVSLSVADGTAVVLPRGLRVQTIEPE